MSQSINKFFGFWDVRRILVGALATAFAMMQFGGQGAAAQDQPWVRHGLSILREPPRPIPPIDVSRAQQQRTQGCQGLSAVRFGYNASFRGTAPDIEWSDTHRKLLAAAALTDNYANATGLIRTVLGDPELAGNARRIVENLLLLTIESFRKPEDFASALATLPSDADAAAPVRADRLFLQAYALANRAQSAADWRQVDQLLGEAYPLDPTFFSIRAYRVIAWLAAAQLGKPLAAGTDAPQCAGDVQAFYNRVLDVSEAAPCPLLVGHFSHYVSRILQDGDTIGLPTEAASQTTRQSPWRVFATGLLGYVSGDRAGHLAALTALEKRATHDASQVSCSGKLFDALKLLDR